MSDRQKKMAGTHTNKNLEKQEDRQSRQVVLRPTVRHTSRQTGSRKASRVLRLLQTTVSTPWTNRLEHRLTRLLKDRQETQTFADRQAKRKTNRVVALRLWTWFHYNSALCECLSSFFVIAAESSDL